MSIDIPHPWGYESNMTIKYKEPYCPANSSWLATPLEDDKSIELENFSYNLPKVLVTSSNGDKVNLIGNLTRDRMIIFKYGGMICFQPVMDWAFIEDSAWERITNDYKYYLAVSYSNELFVYTTDPSRIKRGQEAEDAEMLPILHEKYSQSKQEIKVIEYLSDQEELVVHFKGTHYLEYSLREKHSS